MNFCPVEAALDTYQHSLARGESKDARIRAWLKDSGRVEEAILKWIREDSQPFTDFVSEHEDGYAYTMLALEAIEPTGKDTDWLKAEARKIMAEFVKDQYSEFEDKCVEDEWNYWEES